MASNHLDQDNLAWSDELRESVGDLCNEIVAAALELESRQCEALLVYLEADWNVVSVSVYSKIHDTLYYLDSPWSLHKMVLDLWNRWPQSEKWSAATLLVRDSRFELHLGHPNLQTETSTTERRELVLAHYFPGCKVVYSPPPF